MCKKNIVFLLWQDKPGGIEVLLPEIIKCFPNYYFTAFVFRPLNREYYSVFKNSNIKKIYYGCNNNLKLYIKLFYFLIKNNSSIFHGFNLGPIILLILRLSRVQNIVYSIHGTKYWKNSIKKYIFRTLWKISLSRNYYFTSNSKYSASVFKKKIDKNTKIKVIYNPFNIERFKFKTKNKISLDKLNICYVGRLANGKNLHKWITLVENILTVYPQFKFNIYGNGPLYFELQSFIREKSLEDKIVLKGHINAPEKAYYENDLLLFLSEYESFGNVVVESILCGTPVIASKIPSMEEIFEEFPEFLVELEDNLFENIINKLNDYTHLLKLTREASTMFREKYSLNKHILELKQIYNSFYK